MTRAQRHLAWCYDGRSAALDDANTADREATDTAESLVRVVREVVAAGCPGLRPGTARIARGLVTDEPEPVTTEEEVSRA